MNNYYQQPYYYGYQEDAYYRQPMVYQQAVPQVPAGATITPGGTITTTQPTQGGTTTITQPVFEESYVENILRLNRGKIGTFYMTYDSNTQWNAKIFRGRIEAAGRDHIVISVPETGERILLLMLNLNYVTFDEPINYEYPFQGHVVTEQTPI